MEHKIDFVVTWLDSNDPLWKQSYIENKAGTDEPIDWARFRNTDIFKYWFRAVEMYAPWVNKVFLITNGKFPTWINPSNPKIVLIKHEDYIPAEFLPTFNSYTIELFLHKIKELSEYFVYFNDDMLLNAPVRPDYYFKNGLPCDRNKETYLNVPIYTEKDQFGVDVSMFTYIGIINGDFHRWKTVKQSLLRWFGPHLGVRGLLMSLLLFKQRRFIGFSNYHLEQAFLKSIFEEVWEKHAHFLNASCTKFRKDIAANQYLFRYWQFATNRFYPMKRNGLYFMQRIENLDKIERAISSSRGRSICINDTPLCPMNEFETINNKLQIIFAKKFPTKSSFEI